MPVCFASRSRKPGRADIDAGGRPSPDRNWTEVFAQLVGTVLSVWDAQRLDDAGEDGEVVPSFINLADASIKMVRLSANRPECLTDHNRSSLCL